MKPINSINQIEKNKILETIRSIINNGESVDSISHEIFNTFDIKILPKPRYQVINMVGCAAIIDRFEYSGDFFKGGYLNKEDKGVLYFIIGYQDKFTGFWKVPKSMINQLVKKCNELNKLQK